MGIENKIKKNVTPSGSIFLPEEIRNNDSRTKVYSLEAEFEKTKKNKNYKLYMVLFIFVALVVGLSLIFTYWLKRKEGKIAINIEDFEDMRLKEMVDSVRNRGGNIDFLRIQLQIKEIEGLSKILEIQKNTYQKEM
jgi:hypothetical protein